MKTVAATLRNYFEANRIFTTHRDEINVNLVNTFVGVCLWGHENNKMGDPLTIKELSAKLGMPYTSVSRHLRYLGDFERLGVEGMGLVRTDIYALNRRQKTVSLTVKGKALRDKLLFALGVTETDEE